MRLHGVGVPPEEIERSDGGNTSDPGEEVPMFISPDSEWKNLPSQRSWITSPLQGPRPQHTLHTRSTRVEKDAQHMQELFDGRVASSSATTPPRQIPASQPAGALQPAHSSATMQDHQYRMGRLERSGPEVQENDRGYVGLHHIGGFTGGRLAREDNDHRLPSPSVSPRNCSIPADYDPSDEPPMLMKGPLVDQSLGVSRTALPSTQPSQRSWKRALRSRQRAKAHRLQLKGVSLPALIEISESRYEDARSEASREADGSATDFAEGAATDAASGSATKLLDDVEKEVETDAAADAASSSATKLLDDVEKEIEADGSATDLAEGAATDFEKEVVQSTGASPSASVHERDQNPTSILDSWLPWVSVCRRRRIRSDIFQEHRQCEQQKSSSACESATLKGKPPAARGWLCKYE